MPGNFYSVHDEITLTGSGTPSETIELYLAAPSTHHLNFLGVGVACNHDGTAGDDPIKARLIRVTGTASGTSLTPAKHDTENSLAAQATAIGDSITGLSEVSNSAVWDTYVNPKDFFRPGVKVAPSEKWALALTPGAENRTVKVSFYWEE